MNQSYEKLRSQIIGLLRHVEPKDEETISHAMMALIISMKDDDIHRAGEKEPRLKVVADKADGWRGRVTKGIDVEDSQRGGL